MLRYLPLCHYHRWQSPLGNLGLGLGECRENPPWHSALVLYHLCNLAVLAQWLPTSSVRVGVVGEKCLISRQMISQELTIGIDLLTGHGEIRGPSLESMDQQRNVPPGIPFVSTLSASSKRSVAKVSKMGTYWCITESVMKCAGFE